MRGVSPLTFLRAFPGRRGRPDFKNAPQQIRPDCLQLPRVTKPYEFIGFGAMDVTKPYEFIGFGDQYPVWGNGVPPATPALWCGAAAHQ